LQTLLVAVYRSMRGGQMLSEILNIIRSFRETTETTGDVVYHRQNLCVCVHVYAMYSLCMCVHFCVYASAYVYL
jgi:hypothetical protein